ncbi:MAG: spondin domain-containing protein [Roseibacillus sp.]
MKTTRTTLLAITGGLAFSASAHAATSIRVTVQTTGPVGLAPGFAAFSDGSFNLFIPGTASSSALEQLAETGSPMGLIGTLGGNSGGPIFGPGVGPGSPPIFAPGASSSAIFSVADGHNMFNFASMLLPSNDWFIGNGNGADHDISSLLGAANGATLMFDFTNVWDGGTELEDFDFSPGNGLIGVTNPGGGAADFGTDQNGVISLVSGPDPFSSFANASPGFDSTQFDFTGSSIATVTLEVIPEPSTSLLAGLALATGLLRRRRS